MKTFFATVLAASMLVSSAYAATDNAPLAPGKPAGVKQADITTTTIGIAVFTAAIVAGAAVLISGGNGNGTSGGGSATSTQ